MSGPKNSIIDVWALSALRPVELPSGMKALVKLPDVNELVLHDALPEDLRSLAMTYASKGIALDQLSPEDLKKFVRFTRELVARMLKYLAPEGSAAWDAFRTTGDPLLEGWQPVSITGHELGEMEVDPTDIAALGRIAGRQSTPNDVTLLSRMDRGQIRTPEEATAVEADEPGTKTDDYATFPEEPVGDDGRPDREDVQRPAVRSLAGGRPGRRVRGRRSPSG